MKDGAVPPQARPWKFAVLWLLGLAVLFFFSYSTANWLAGQRAHVPSMVFDWESRVPYWPWTIVPYWSIDLFYAVSLFVCTTRRELDTHARRLLAAQLISVAVFLAAPLRYSFERPETTGLFGALFDALLLFDKPFNQAPALHISLLVILWVHYIKHIRGMWRRLLQGWFILIGISVITTYQHHFFDVPTGMWVGWFCVWLFPDDAAPVTRTLHPAGDPRRRQLAAAYAAGAVLTGLAAVLTGGWGLWLMWVAGSLLLVSLIYAALDPSAFQKRADGSMSPASWWLLAPYLAGAWANSRWWTRRTQPAHEVTPGLWIGRLPGSATELPSAKFTLVDLCAELPCPAATAARSYVSLPALDLVPLSARQLSDNAQHITCAIAGGPVWVCCALGYSRSAAAVAAWLITSGRAADARDAVALIQRARPQAVLGGQQCRTLDELARAR
jgi:protein-tyrosine phosphatase